MWYVALGIGGAYLVNVVARSAREIPLVSQPVTLNFHFEAALDDRVPRKLGEGALRELVYLDRALGERNY